MSILKKNNKVSPGISSQPSMTDLHKKKGFKALNKIQKILLAVSIPVFVILIAIAAVVALV